MQAGDTPTICGVEEQLHPLKDLADDATLTYHSSEFYGLTISHNTHSEKEVDFIMKQVASIGGTVVKPAQKVYWGGYSGYFKDLDGYLFEVAFNPFWDLDNNDNLLL